MSKRVEKAYEITDARISFVSLVDKAANKRQFLITKAEGSEAEFASYGRIIKADPESHYVTGIVYEPMTEDAHGNFMTEEEITKAAYWYAKHGDQVDLQHSFEPLEKAAVVESYIAPCDMEVGGEPVTKGTWIMTVEINDPEIFDAIRKGEITGLSMGGIGKYSDEDVDIEGEDVQKGEEPAGTDVAEKRGILKRLSKFLGLGPVEKGEMADKFAATNKYSSFWDAFYTLEDLLYRYNWQADRWEFESDEATVTEALAEFNAIVTGILTGGQPVAKALADTAIIKAGKAMSTANRNTLTSIYESLGAFLEKFNETEQEDEEVTKQEIIDAVAEGIAKANTPADPTPAPAADPTPNFTADDIQKMVEAAVQKAMGGEEEKPADPVDIEKMIADAVEKAMEPVRKMAGLPTNLNDQEDGDPVEKQEEPHYLAGLL